MPLFKRVTGDLENDEGAHKGFLSRLRVKLQQLDIGDDDAESTNNPAPDSPTQSKGTILGKPVQRFRYTEGALIGQGAFGEVYTVEKDGTTYACKRQSKKFIKEHRTERMVQNEYLVMKHLADAPNAVQLIEAIETRSDVYFIMELCAGGDVLQSIAAQFDRTGLFTERSAATMARHMLGCVLQLHERNVVHRDLKPENFMFWKSPEGKVMLKVCDFGLANSLEGDETLCEPCGTPNYMAPEMWSNESYDKKVDVWSMGCCLAVMVTGILPIDGKDMDEISAKARQPINFRDEWPWGFFSPDLLDLLKKMLEVDPKKRISVAEALAHPWVKENGTAKDTNLDFNIRAGLTAYMKANAVQRAACQLLAQNCTREELRELKKRFEAVDTDGDGMISLEEILSAVANGVYNWAAFDDEQAKILFESFDRDQSGYIDFNEYISGIMHIRSLHDENRIKAAFEHLDEDGDGKITKDELISALKKTRQSVYQVPAVLAQIDADGDGTITYEEFSTYWKKILNMDETEAQG